MHSRYRASCRRRRGIVTFVRSAQASTFARDATRRDDNESFNAPGRHKQGRIDVCFKASGRHEQGGVNESFNARNGDRRRNGSHRLVRPLDHEHRDARLLGEYQPARHARLSLSRRRDRAKALRAPGAELPDPPIGASSFNGSWRNPFFSRASAPFFGRASAPYFKVVDGPYFKVVEDPFFKGDGARSDG
jgi:hypothetical protein